MTKQKSDESKISVEDIRNKLSNGMRLVIPYYQRGYRWTREELRQLLSDIAEHEAGKPYFLQLLAYRCVKNDKENWRIIDGQQRLTSVMLTLETIAARRRSNVVREEILQKVNDWIVYDRTNQRDGLDSHFKQDAVDTVQKWCQENSEKVELVEVRLLKSVFLRYEATDGASELEMFRRINKWKISATDSEIVKCHLLADGEQQTRSDFTRALEWNLIERRLSDDAFWCWMAPAETKYDSDRIGLLLEYAGFGGSANADGSIDKFRLSKSCRKQISDCQNRVDTVWNRVSRTFRQLQEMYRDDDLYHKFGWLVHRVSKECSVVRDLSSGDVAEVFSREANECFNAMNNSGMLREDVDLYVSEARGKYRIVNLLFLSNVAWCSSNRLRYDFASHRKVGDLWSVEHIHAKNQDKLDEYSFRSLAYKSNVKSVDELWHEYCLKDSATDEAETFLAGLLDSRANYPRVDEDHSLGNLALLPKNTNSSLGNMSFPYKLSQVLEWSVTKKGGYWVPPMTLAIFSKEISAGGWPYWSMEDRKAYKNLLTRVVGEFIEAKGGRNE